MQYIKPIDADIWLIYECSCGQRHEARRAETIFPGGVLCSCGKQLRFKPIEHLRLTPQYKGETEEKLVAKPTGTAQATNMALELSRNIPEPQTIYAKVGKNDVNLVDARAVNMLIHQGFDKVESTKMVCRARTTTNTQDVGELIRCALKLCDQPS